MNKFEKMLSGSSNEIISRRAKNVVTDLIFEQDAIINDKERDMRELDRAIDSLIDIYPDSTFSTMVVKNDFNAKNWVTQMQELKVKKVILQVELDVAKETKSEWLTDIKEGKEE